MTNPFRYVNDCDPEWAIPRSRALQQVLCHIQRGEYVCVLAPRQSGKTTFVKCDLLPQLRGRYQVCLLDLEHVPSRAVLPTFQGALKSGGAPAAGQDPGQRVRYSGLKDWLNRGAGQRQCVFLIDELPKDDAVAIDLLTNVRAYFTEASSEPKARQHLFVFAGSDELVHLTSRDSPVSVFNIAHEVQLEDFTLAESSTLIRRLARRSERVRLFNARTIDRVFALTQGHPYLVQLLCSWIYDNHKQRDAVLASAENAVRLCRIEASTNAKAMMGRLNQDDVMVKEGAILEAVVTGGAVPFTATVMAHRTLHLQGCIRDNDGLCAVRNPIYKAIFRRFFKAAGFPKHRPSEAERHTPTAVSMTKEQEDQLKALIQAVFKGMTAAARKAFVKDAIGREHKALNNIDESIWGEAPSVAADAVASALYRYGHRPAPGGYDLVTAICRKVRAEELDGNPDIQPHLERACREDKAGPT